MGITVKEKTPPSADDVAKAKAILAAAEQANPTPPSKVALELAIYTRYNRGGHIFEGGKVYQFSQAQADILLREVEPETERPVWRRYVQSKNEPAPVPVQKINQGRPMVDMSDSSLTVVEEAPKSINIGDDSEIADIIASAATSSNTGPEEVSATV